MKPRSAGHLERWASWMIYVRLFLIPLIGCVIFVRSASISAAPLSDDVATALASAYIEADFDDRQMVYQSALSQLQMVQMLDAELTKAKPSSLMTSASPAWKAARADFLARISPILASLFARERILAAYRKGFASYLTPEEADVLMSFFTSREGRIYFLARRLVGRQKALESYILLTATNRSNLPELVPAQTVQSDMNQLSRESKDIGKPDQETIDRVKAIGEGAAWKKLQRMTTAGVLDSLRELAANGQLDGSQGLVQQVVKKAVDDFKGPNQ